MQVLVDILVDESAADDTGLKGTESQIFVPRIAEQGTAGQDAHRIQRAGHRSRRQ